MPDEQAALEMLRCAEVNMDSVQKMVPVLTRHPHWIIVKDQLATAIKMLEEPSDA